MCNIQTMHAYSKKYSRKEMLWAATAAMNENHSLVLWLTHALSILVREGILKSTDFAWVTQKKYFGIVTRFLFNRLPAVDD